MGLGTPFCRTQGHEWPSSGFEGAYERSQRLGRTVGAGTKNRLASLIIANDVVRSRVNPRNLACVQIAGAIFCSFAGQFLSRAPVWTGPEACPNRKLEIRNMA